MRIAVKRVLGFALPTTLLFLALPSTFASTFVYTAGRLNHDRQFHTATLLQNGKVLVVGGVNNDNQVIGTAELYNPATGTWSYTGSLHVARKVHTATLLSNGAVLIAGGRTNSATTFYAETYNPVTGTFAIVGNIQHDRYNHTATLLPNGNVLIAGGYNNNGIAINSAEIFSGTTHTFSFTGSMRRPRGNPGATLLGNGQVLLVAGKDENGRSQNTAEVYSSMSGTFSYTTYPLLQHLDDRSTATMLQTGKVLIAGGWDDTVGDSGGYELYNPLTSSFSWSPGSGPGNFAFLWYSTAPLQNGKVLFAGGRCVGSPNECTWGATTADAFLYDPSTGNAPLTVSLPHDLAKATATLLQNGQVLVAGGVNNDGTTVNISELYTY